MNTYMRFLLEKRECAISFDSESYTEYWKANAHRFSSALRRIQGDMLLPDAFEDSAEWLSLHDAEIDTVDFRSSGATIRLSLWLALPSGGTSRLRLNYDGVVHVQPGNVQELASSIGDLLFHEVELLKGGLYAHRMLFASGREIEVAFSKLTLDLGPEEVAPRDD